MPLSPMQGLLVSPVQLEYLTAASEAETWAEAAQQLGVTASAFSQGMSQLERRLGVQLFEPRGRQRALTPEGEEAVALARRVLREHRELASWAASVRDGSVGSVRAGMIDTAAVHHFASALLSFRAAHQEADLKLEVSPSGELVDRLRNGLLDVAVVVEEVRGDIAEMQADYDVTPLLVEDLHVYAPPGTKPVHPKAWGPWVTFPSSSRTRGHIGRALRKLGSEFDVVAESSQPAVLREMVHLGMGWTVLAPIDAEREPHALRRMSEDPVGQRRLVLVRRSGREATPLVERLCAELIQSVRT